jgi:hypothetical protein
MERRGLLIAAGGLLSGAGCSEVLSPDDRSSSPTTTDTEEPAVSVEPMILRNEASSPQSLSVSLVGQQTVIDENYSVEASSSVTVPLPALSAGEFTVSAEVQDNAVTEVWTVNQCSYQKVVVRLAENSEVTISLTEKPTCTD